MFKRGRFAWHLSRILALIFVAWGYGVLGSAFVGASPEYQWILGLLTPIPREIFAKLLLKVIYKAAGDGSQGNKWIEFLTQHYVLTKHAVFLAVIVGGVATPATNYCIVAVDFAEAMIDGLKVIRKYNHGQDIKGTYESDCG